MVYNHALFFMFRSILFSLIALSLTNCSGFQGASGDESYPKSREQRQLDSLGKITGEDGITFGGNKKKSAATEGINVNGYLWRATLDNVYFMPVISADPFGGVVLTDWYKASNTTKERYKLNIYITGTELRSDAVRVAAFKQKLGKAGTWVDVDADPKIGKEIEDKILLRARELRYSSAS